MAGLFASRGAASRMTILLQVYWFFRLESAGLDEARKWLIWKLFLFSPPILFFLFFSLFWDQRLRLPILQTRQRAKPYPGMELEWRIAVQGKWDRRR